MITLILLLSLLAGECRVHRVPMADTVGCEIAVGVVSRMPQGCLTKSHWIDTCKMRCDTTYAQCSGLAYFPQYTCYRWVERGDTIVRCYPDTVESDSGYVMRFDSSTVCTVKVYPAYGQLMKLIYNPPDSSSIPPCLDSAELADIREMLREWRVARCIQTAIAKAKDNGSWWFGDVDDRTLRDSCRCLYERKEKP